MSDLCSLCGQPLDDARPWQRSWIDEDEGAHLDCLETLLPDEEEEERNE